MIEAASTFKNGVASRSRSGSRMEAMLKDKIRKYILGVQDHQEKKDKEGRRALSAILQVSCSPSSMHEVELQHLLMDVGQHLLRDARRTRMTTSTDGCCYDEGFASTDGCWKIQMREHLLMDVTKSIY
ncbi:hypothetical protein LR48_Vigan221s002400 [Vigna angularis]|uniref:Uncharacterized protein n=1 Tax=Phaseolus angularis TaxID=3914 RepID=A0A0L9T653_PHAAN|nr:hypothetical protein LR48_Vigan221s002400 [Vigna angularis]